MIETVEHPLGRLDAAACAALFTEARTAKTFADTPVGDDQLTAIWELARWAPTSSNCQPLRVLFVRPGPGRDRLIVHMKDNNKIKTAAAPAVAVLAADTRFHEHIPLVSPQRLDKQATLEADEAARLRESRFNATLQAGYFVLAVRAAGLAAGPMGGFDAAGIDADFFPDGRLRTILVVNIGHPGESAWRERQARLDPADAVSWV